MTDDYAESDEPLIPEMPEPRRELTVNLKLGKIQHRMPAGVIDVQERHFLLDVRTWTSCEVQLKTEGGQRLVVFHEPNAWSDKDDKHQLAITMAPGDEQGNLSDPDAPPPILLAFQSGVAQQVQRLLHHVKVTGWPATHEVVLAKASLDRLSEPPKDAPKFLFRLQYVTNVPQPDVFKEFPSPRDKAKNGHI